MAVAGAWALTSGIGPLETARTALSIAPGGAESRPESAPGKPGPIVVVPSNWRGSPV